MCSSKLSLVSSLCLVVAGLLCLAPSLWILHDYPAVRVAATEVRTQNTRGEDVTVSLDTEDYYGVYSRVEGWGNLVSLLAGFSVLLVVLGLAGFLPGLHTTTASLLLTYLVCLVVVLMLQAGALLILSRRHTQLSTHLPSSFHYREKFLLETVSLAWSGFSLLVTVATLLVRTRQPSKQLQVTPL